MRRHYARVLQAAWLTGVVLVTAGCRQVSPPVPVSSAAVPGHSTQGPGTTGTGGSHITSGGNSASGGVKSPRAIACDRPCMNFVSRTTGSGQVMTALAPGSAGQELYLGPALKAGPNGDFIASAVGRVVQFCGVTANNFFVSSSYVCEHYPNSRVYELIWAPAGNQSGLCAGVAQAGVTGENVTLQTCGMRATTTWIFDPLHEAPGTLACTASTSPPVSPGGLGHFCPLINGGDTGSKNPLVLTVDTGTSGPLRQLKVRHELLLNGVAGPDQQFAARRGPAA